MTKYKVRLNYSDMGLHTNLSWITGFIMSFANGNSEEITINVTKHMEPEIVDQEVKEEA